jgi:hypothetical protein
MALTFCAANREKETHMSKQEQWWDDLSEQDCTILLAATNSYFVAGIYGRHAQVLDNDKARLTAHLDYNLEDVTDPSDIGLVADVEAGAIQAVHDKLCRYTHEQRARIASACKMWWALEGKQDVLFLRTLIGSIDQVMQAACQLIDWTRPPIPELSSNQG